MGLSLFGFIINLMSFDFANIDSYFSKLMPRKYLGYSIIFLGFAIGMMWLGRIAASLFEGIPNGLEHYTTLPIQALDLGIVVPAAIISGFLLIGKKKLGYLLAPIIIIKGITLLLAIDAMSISLLISGVSVSMIELLVFSLATLIYSFNLYLIFNGLNSQQHFSIN